MGEYIPEFCPNCGHHLNEVAFDDYPKPEQNGTYRCGWCHGTHPAIEDIVFCRRARANGTTVEQERELRRLAQAVRHQQVRAELLQIYRDLM